MELPNFITPVKQSLLHKDFPPFPLILSLTIIGLLFPGFTLHISIKMNLQHPCFLAWLAVTFWLCMYVKTSQLQMDVFSSVAICTCACIAGMSSSPSWVIGEQIQFIQHDNPTTSCPAGKFMFRFEPEDYSSQKWLGRKLNVLNYLTRQHFCFPTFARYTTSIHYLSWRCSLFIF